MCKLVIYFIYVYIHFGRNHVAVGDISHSNDLLDPLVLIPCSRTNSELLMQKQCVGRIKD